MLTYIVIELKDVDKQQMIKTVSDSQEEILLNIRKLHCNDVFDADLTYGNGVFWKNIGSPAFCCDISPVAGTAVLQADSTNVPVIDGAFNSVVFDPPFLTYIKQGRDSGSIMGKRFSGYWSYDELADHYSKTIDECHRILKKKGILVFKCQDIVHNHKLHPTHMYITNWATKSGFRLKDMFILTAKNRIPVRAAKHGIQTQKHARIHHSYFLVLEKL